MDVAEEPGRDPGTQGPAGPPQAEASAAGARGLGPSDGAHERLRLECPSSIQGLLASLRSPSSPPASWLRFHHSLLD